MTVPYTPLTDELLARITQGSGHVYSHEAKSMAAELLQWRKKAADAKAAAAATPVPGLPYYGKP